MSSTHRIELAGCTPEPLMSYLKALGVLRLVGEQAEAEAVALWVDDVFVLDTALSRESITAFFLESYAPTPILGPWAGGSGFFGNDNRIAVEAILASSEARLGAYRLTIQKARQILADEEFSDKPTGDQKARLLRRYRREMPDLFVRWMDAALSLGSDSEWYAPLLGTGGNDGRLDFTQNFMQRVVDLGFHEARPSKASAKLLRSALWGEPVAGLGKAAVGQFSPGRAGGPNATQGMEAGSTDNPWDFLLALEGTLLLSSAAVRRLGVSAAGRAAFPFTVASRAVGNGSGSDDEAAEARGELWLPLWHGPTSASEIELLFTEGRADVGGKPARDAVEFSRAVAGLGTDRGIAAFARYALLKRSGKAYLAVAAERFQVPDAPLSGMDLLSGIDPWREEFFARVRGDASARLQAAARRIESQIFAYSKHGRREDLLGLLVTLGIAERELAATGGMRAGKVICRPVPDLSESWIEATMDGSPEYEVALALAGLCRPADPLADDGLPDWRKNLEPVQRAKWGWTWDEAAPAVVWQAGGLVTNLTAVLTRRLLDGGKAALSFVQGVRLGTIARFIAEDLDDLRVEELIWALALVRPTNIDWPEDRTAPPLPRAFALLKSMVLPWPIEYQHATQSWRYDRSGGDLIKPEPRVLPLLRAGQVADACAIAARRLLVSGAPPLDGAATLGGDVRADRLAAALLLPIRATDLTAMLGLICRPPVLEMQREG